MVFSKKARGFSFEDPRKERLMYDYVIVGAGSAGCVLANRMTEDPGVTVLLLEAGGPDRKQEIHIPAAFSKLFKSPYDWAYYTQEQHHLNDRQLYWPRGKVLGGSSSINAMIYTRGNRHDYDTWYELGNEGWGFVDVLPYFKKAQHQERGASEYHGVGGPLNVADLRSVNPLSQIFIEAGVEIGLPRSNDFNAETQEGVGLFQVTQKQGKRHSAADAYLKPVLNRPNLTVQTQAHATHLIIEETCIVGIEYVQNGQPKQVRVNREVILSGGVINSPQLLMLSGIGPADHLRALGIEVVVDLPGVGHNLQDHLAVPVASVCTQPISLASAETMGNILTYVLFKKGPLSSNIGEAGAFIKTQPHLPIPDLELLFGPVYFLNHGFTRIEGHGFTIGLILLHPESQGHITLCSSDPLESPAIQPNYLASEADVKVLVEGVKFARRLAQTKAFDPFLGAEVTPGPQVQTDQAIAETLCNTAETIYHPVGTCKMGSDPMAVVDAELRVRGILGLRVVDASIMPTMVSGHTNAVTIMIAEKAADLIKESAHAPVHEGHRSTTLHG
jgi:choline dehydrogenase